MLLNFVRHLINVSPYFFPAYLIRFQVVGIPFTALEGFTYLLFALWCMERIRDQRAFVWTARMRRYCYTAVLFLMGASLATVVLPPLVQLPDGNWVDVQRMAWGVWKGWIVAPLLYFIVIAQVLKTPEQIESLLRQFVYSATALALLSYAYSLFDGGITYDLRLRGLFESANYLAMYLIPALLLNIHWIMERDHRKKRQNYVDTATATILAYTVVFTQSYAGMLAVFGALVLYALYSFHRRGNLKKTLLALGGLGLVILLIIGTQMRTNKFQKFLDWQGRSSTSVRLELYQVSAALLRERPFLGIGLGQFQNQYQTRATEILGRTPLEWNMPHPHNLFLAFWMNAGILGLIALILFLLWTHQSWTYPLIALWGILLHGLFDTPFWKNDLAMIFWLLIATILIAQGHAKHSAKKPTHSTAR